MRFFKGPCWRSDDSADDSSSSSSSSSASPPPRPLREEAETPPLSDEDNAGDVSLTMTMSEARGADGRGTAATGGDRSTFPGECGVNSLLVTDALVLDSSLVSKLQGRRLRRKEWRKRKTWTTGALLLLIGGAANALFGALSLVWTPFNIFMKERLNMRPGLPAYDWWVVPPAVFTSVYIFNVTNSQRFLSGEDSMLQLQEIGPIVYMEILEHKNVTFHPNSTLTYVGHRHLVFKPEETNVDLNATLIVPNLSVLGISSYLHDASFFTKIGLSVLLQRLHSQPFSHISIYDYMWDYKDPLLQVARNLAPFLVPVNNMGILNMLYMESADEVTVHMGPGSEHSFFTMDRYHGNPRFNYWADERCDTVKGATEGVVYPQEILRNDSLRYFRKTLCRVAPITYAADLVRDGVDAFRFELPDNFFDRFEDPSTDCFAGDPTAPLVSGLSDVSPCYYNFPIAASSPHFMNGDPILVDSIGGLNPQRNKHMSYVVVEPLTGIPMESCARVQSNLVVRKLSGLPKKLGKFSNLTIPMFWAEYHQRGLPWYIYDLVYFTVNILPDLQSWLSFVMLTCGCGMLIAGTLSVLCARKRSRMHSYKFLDLTPPMSSSSSSSSSSS